MSQADIDVIQGMVKKYFLFCLPAWIVSGALFVGLLAYYLVSSVGTRFVLRIAAPPSFLAMGCSGTDDLWTHPGWSD